MPGMDNIPETGPEAIAAVLQRMNLQEMEDEQRAVIKSGKKTARPRAVRMLNIIEGLKRNKMNAGQMMVQHVPVVPPQFRPFSVMGDTFITGDSNELYRDLVEYKRLYEQTRKTLGDDAAKDAYADMAAAARALYGYGDSPNPKVKARGTKGFFDVVTGTNPKHSFWQSKMLAKPMDTVGRSVIIPDADYSMNEVGMPEEMAWKLYGSYIQRRMVRGGMSPAGALKHIKDRTPQALLALKAELPERPVVLTRAPSWHRFNTIGQVPRLIKGDAIKTNTFVMEGLAGDFDGDCQFAYISLLRRKKTVLE